MALLFGLLLWLFINGQHCEQVEVLPGDLTIGGLFSIYDPSSTEDGDICNLTKISLDSVIELEAVKWTIQRLNEINFIPGVRLGMLALPTCRSRQQTSLMTNDLINLMQNENKTLNVVGLIGPTYSSEAETVSTILSLMPTKYRLPQIGYSTTSDYLGNHNLYPNFFRTIPSDSVQMKALSSLLVTLEWNMIHIIYENDAYGKYGAMLLTDEAKRLGICIPVTSKIEIENLDTLDLQISTSINESSDHMISGIVFIGGDQTARRLLETVNQRKSPTKPGFIFSESVQSVVSVFLNDNNTLINASKGVLLMSPTKNVIEDFRKHLSSLFTNSSNLLVESSSNPWLLQVYKELSGCEISDFSCFPILEEDVLLNLPETVFISYAIKATLTLTKAIQTMKFKLCNNRNVLCDKLKFTSKNMFVKELESIKVDFESGFLGLNLPQTLSSLEFDHNGNVIYDSKNSRVYEVYNHRTCLGNKDQFCLVKVADYGENKTDLNKNDLKDYDINGNELSTYRKAQCPVGNICSACLSADESVQTFYIPGDFIMITTFPVHDKGSNALSCSKIRSDIGLDIALTAQYIVEKVNSKTGIFKNLFPDHTIGLILIDGCNEPLVIRNKVLSLFRSESMPGLPIDIKYKVIGMIGSLGSTPTVALAEVSTNLKIPHVGCCSTSATLSDRKSYPYFARVSSPVNRNAEVLISIADILEGKYVQIVYSEGEYGESGKNTIVEEAKKRHICIAQIIQVVENVDYDKVLPALRRFPDARFVLIVLRSHVGPPIIKHFINDNTFDAGEFQFITSETWGTRDNYKEAKLVGSITVAQEMTHSDEYLTWLTEQLPNANDQNKWLQSFIEKRYNCYFPWSFNKQASRQCDDNDRLPGNSNQRLDPWTPYLLNAQLSLLIGADSAIKGLCPRTEGNILCHNYTQNPGIVMDHIKQVKLDLAGIGRPVEVFDKNGDGVYGYAIYNLQQLQNLEYIKVGGGLPEDLEFQTDRLQFPSEHNIPSKCSQKEECQQCFLETDANNAPVTEKGTSANLLYAVIGILSVLLAVLAIVMFVRFKKSHKRIDSTYMNPSDDSPYITTSDSELYRKNEAFSYDDIKSVKSEGTSADGTFQTDIGYD